MNPILQAVQDLIASGLTIEGVFLDRIYQPSNIAFHFAGGAAREVKIDVDNAQFMQWWHDAASYYNLHRGT